MSDVATNGTKDRLQELPTIFHWRDLVAIGSTAGAARVTVNRWAKQDRIEPIGGMSGLYRIVTRDLDLPLWVEVFRRYLPDAIVAGRAALRLAHWMADDDTTVDLIVPPKLRPPQVPDVSYRHRTRVWMQRVVMADTTLYGFPVLAPEYALADLLNTDAAWVTTTPLQIPVHVSMSDVRTLAATLKPLYPRAQSAHLFDIGGR